MHNLGSTAQQRYRQTENAKLKAREATKRYLQTQNGREKLREAYKRYVQTQHGRGKLRETQNKYELTNKGKERRVRYQTKPFHCDICNCNKRTDSKFRRLKSKKHISKLT